CPQYLLGDFAFAIRDDRQQIFFCARDHIGARPFYYSSTPERVVFASDIKRVLSMANSDDRLDEPFIATGLTEQIFYHDEHTFFETVRKLPPAHTLTIGRDQFKIERYWFPEHSPEVRYRSGTEYIEAFLDIYRRAFRDYLGTEDPVGVHITGGLDSSSIAVLT